MEKYSENFKQEFSLVMHAIGHPGLLLNGTANVTIQYETHKVIFVLNLITLNLSIIGNGILLFFTLKQRSKSRFRATNYILNIVFIDFLISFTHIPFNMDNQVNLPIHNNFVCKFLESIKFLLVSCSVNITASLSVCRWQLTRHRNFKSHLKSEDRLYILIAWLISIVSSFPASFVNGLDHIDNEEVYCGEAWHRNSSGNANKVILEAVYQVYVNIVHFTIPGTVICFTYTNIRYSLRFQGSMQSCLHSSSQLHQKIVRKSRKVVRLATILMLTFIFCWLPIHIWHIIEIVPTWFQILLSYTILQSLFHWVAISYCALNPIIVLCSDSIYQKSLWKEVKFIKEKIWPESQKAVRNSTSLYFINRPRRTYVRSRLCQRSFSEFRTQRGPEGFVMHPLVDFRILKATPYNKGFEFD